MRHHARYAALVATAVGLTAAGIAITTQTASAHDTIHGHETVTTFSTQKGGDPKTPVGNVLAFASKVIDKKGHALATSGGTCSQFAGDTDANAVYHCTQSYHFSGGDLFVGGIYDAAAKEIHWPIMGGNGKYRGASGELTFLVKPNLNFEDTFDIN